MAARRGAPARCGGDRAGRGRREAPARLCGRKTRLCGRKNGAAPPLCGLIPRFSRRLYPPPDVQGHEFELHCARYGRAAADAKTTAAVGPLVFRVRRLDPAARTVAVLEFLRPLPATTRRSRTERRRPPECHSAGTITSPCRTTSGPLATSASLGVHPCIPAIPAVRPLFHRRLAHRQCSIR